MPPKIALILCIIFVLRLLYIERKDNSDASLTLWLPTIWMLICASRPVGSWFTLENGQVTRDLGAGNPINQLVLVVLFVFSLGVLISKNVNLHEIVKDNKWLFVLYAYMGISILWSSFPSISFRRWIKVSITLVMASVILTERFPFKGMESILRRCAYVLVPFSFVLIKYFANLGRQYNRWTGELMWTGVAGQKNGLGLLCAISIFFIVWSYISRRNLKETDNNALILYDILILALSMYLLFGNRGSYSATSIFILIVGTTLLFILSRKESLTEKVAKRLKLFLIIGVLTYIFMNSVLLPVITSSLGRDTSLTGRTEIWSTALSIANHHPVLGAGYGDLMVEDIIWKKHGVLQTHNGYIGIYVYLGVIGLSLLTAFLLRFASTIAGLVKSEFHWAVFGICYFFMLLLYNYTECTFLGTSLTWTLTVYLSFLFSVDLRGK